MEDREVVAAIVAGDPGGIAEAYDRYAMPLYAYCRSLLREPADAADAVQDTFVIATSKVGGLRDPSKLRPWLYAVARNECLRQLRAGDATAPLDEAAEVPNESADLGSAAEQEELRRFVIDAINGLNPGARDVIELSLRHDLNGDDLADALGVPRNHAHALLSRARSQLERSLGALVVARTGRQACPALDAVLAGWDGRMTVLLRKRISRHIEQCEVCGERKRRELSPALFLGAFPVAALTPGFREQVLRISADQTSAGLAHRASVTSRAGSFAHTGFPKPLVPPGTSAWHQLVRHSQAGVAWAATGAAVVGVGAVLIVAGVHHSHASAEGSGGVVRHSAAAHPAGTSSSPGRGTSPANGGRVLAAPSAASGPAGSSAPAGQATTPSTTVSSQAASPSSAASTSHALVQGSLTVSVSKLKLVAVAGLPIGTFTLTAQGGPVSSFSVSGGAGQLTVSPSSGSIASGASVTVTVTATSLVALETQITVNPGGHVITVLVTLSL
jgi:RNA polymerase sigma factor (sigma-70 family)